MRISCKYSSKDPFLHFQVATKVTRPYFDFTKTNDSSEIPYRGYAVDLIDAIFNIINKDHNLNWEYEFYALEKTGNPIAGSKKWDGLLGDVIEHVSYFKTNKNVVSMKSLFRLHFFEERL